MTLRQRLILLHSAFAAFAVLTALVLVYAVQLHLREAADRFEALVNEVQQTEELRVELKTLDVHLHEVLAGRRAADALFVARKDALLTRLAEVARYSAARTDVANPDGPALLQLGGELAAAVNQCLAALADGHPADAAALFKRRIEPELIPALDGRLQEGRRRLDAARQTAGSRLVERDTQTLVLALLIAASGVGLVVSGALIVRRRLVMPIRTLLEATHAFARGDLAHRVALSSGDELSQLGAALNEMAASLTVSQQKYRSLFENLRDAVFICDAEGRIRECHNGDAELFAADAVVDRRPWEVWGGGRSSGCDWQGLLDEARAAGHPVHLNDVVFRLSARRNVVVDVVAYAVEFASAHMVAVVLRDVTERHELERLGRRAETMEAAVTFARGVAHDFKNMLHSANASLDLIADQTPDSQTLDRVRTAQAACRQAASLSRRLTHFAASDAGQPEQLCVSETVSTILRSLDEAFLAGITLEVACDQAAAVFIDRDQLTQIVLNLLGNAREALPEGGVLRIAVGVEEVAHPLAPQRRAAHARVTVQDTGCGMSPEVKQRLFEPLFSTKPRNDYGPRGMGLAVVYAAVQSAGGFIRVDSELGVGTTFRVYFPLAAAVPRS